MNVLALALVMAAVMYETGRLAIHYFTCERCVRE